jgi:hypothetical protein
MSIDYKYVWPATNTTAVAALQDIAANGSAVLNGSFASNSPTGQISFINQGVIRAVSLTSANNLSARTFTVSGIQNGAAVTENITGPNNNTVYGTGTYDVITSVTTNGTSNGVSIGTGKVGYFPLIPVNTEVEKPSCWQLSVHIPLSPASGLSYQAYMTLDNIVNNHLSFDAMGLSGSGLIYDKIWAGGNQTTSQFAYQATPLGRYVLIQIVASTTPTTDTVYATFLQT